MAEGGCLRDVAVQNLEVGANLSLTNDLTVGGVIKSTDATNFQTGGNKIIFGSATSTTAASTVSMTVTQPANTILVNAGIYCLETTAAATANLNTGVMVGTVAAGAGVVGDEICVLDPNGLEATDDTDDGILQGNCMVVAGDVGMTGVNNAADMAFVSDAIRATVASRTVHITLVSSANTASNALDAGTAPVFAGSTNIGGLFAATTNALLPFIVVRQTPLLPVAEIASATEIGLFHAALSDV